MPGLSLVEVAHQVDGFLLRLRDLVIEQAGGRLAPVKLGLELG